ncbi:hypothetical protein Tsubulata_038578 [Turnera subulata]|uniref:Late embryogenesis abundant protein LEA-2 subgroup domain-containing protein n=1 Tax=Turnera subulata TaxID=218843 RepID=A0A9Q0G7I0_9ROSI|nr:hypothetical protein Tsubulata_038578 [Turnera subulata]
MTDKVYPAAKQAAANGSTVGPNPAFPATKGQLYGATRPAYRPTPTRKRSRRGCFCACCLWTTIVILTLIFLAAVAGIVVYLLYRPHRPDFDVSGLKISSLNLTAGNQLATNINLNITARNPNKKAVFTYNPIAISVTTEKDGIAVGNGVIASFVHGTKNTTVLKASITSTGQNYQLDDVAAGKLKSDLKGKNGVALKLKLDTKVKAKLGALKSPKVMIRVTCDGIRAMVPSGKKATTGSVSNAKCKVDLRVKIWKWTF